MHGGLLLVAGVALVSEGLVKTWAQYFDHHLAVLAVANHHCLILVCIWILLQHGNQEVVLGPVSGDVIRFDGGIRVLCLVLSLPGSMVVSLPQATGHGIIVGSVDKDRSW